VDTGFWTGERTLIRLAIVCPLVGATALVVVDRGGSPARQG